MSRTTRIAHRSCPLCEAHCGLRVELERAPDGSREGVRTIRGDPEDPLSQGYLCPKAYGLKGLHEDPDRLRHPLVRSASGLHPASWEDALDRAAEGLVAVRDTYGPDSVATYVGNPNAHDLGSLFYLAPIVGALGTRWRFSAASVDQLPKMLSCQLLFGGPYSIPVPDLDRTDLLLILGANPVVSNGSLMTAPDMPRRLRELRARGGRLIVVDPRRSETAALADSHVFIRPGSDALLLLAMIHVLFEERRVTPGRLEGLLDGVDTVRQRAAAFAPEAVSAATGITAERIRSLAREFSAAPRAACYGRVGTSTQAFGTLASWGIDVLHALTGNLDRAGGAMFPTPAASIAGLARGAPGELPLGRWRSRVRQLPEFNGELPVSSLAEEIDQDGDDRVRALITFAGNPVLSTPNAGRLDRALAGLEFMISVDMYLNETTRHADVVLPPPSHLERSNADLFFFPLSVRNFVRFSRPTLAPAAGALAQWEILLELAARVAGVPAQALETGLLAGLAGAAGATPEQVEAVGKEPGPERLFDLLLRTGPTDLSLGDLLEAPHGIDLGPLEPRLPNLLHTATGRVPLAPPEILGDLERLARARDLDPPELVLIGRRHLRSNNSWMHNLPSLAKGAERCTLLLNPEDATRRHIEAKSMVLVRSRVGSVRAPAQISDEVMPGVVSLPHGFGHDARDMRQRVAARRPGVNSNSLADETLLDELSGNAVLNGIPVEVEPV
ncbi:MAG: molybdopterin-dependent oxidoreductase [Myxococcota bacterium]